MAEDLELLLKETFRADADEAPLASPELAHLVRSRVARGRLILAGVSSGALVAAAITTVLVLAQPQQAPLQALPTPSLTTRVAAPATEVTRPNPTTTPPAVSTPATTAATQPDPARTGALGGASFSCVEKYSVAAVAKRSFSFDGTVKAIHPGTTNRDGAGFGAMDTVAVTFAVNEWWRGGSAATVTVDMQSPRVVSDGGGVVSSGGPVVSIGDGPAVSQGATASPSAFEVGTRLLVSGEPRWGGPPLKDAISWGCGFTRYYDAATAAQWRAAAQH